RKSGASGAGAWVKSADRVTALEGDVETLQADVAELQEAGSIGFLINTARNINFTTSTKRMTIAVNLVYLVTGPKRYLMPETDVALPEALGWHRIEYDPDANEVVFSPYSDALA